MISLNEYINQKLPKREKPKNNHTARKILTTQKRIIGISAEKPETLEKEIKKIQTQIALICEIIILASNAK